MKVQNSMHSQQIWIHGLIRSMAAQNTDISLFSVIDTVENGICVNKHFLSTGIFLLFIISFLLRKEREGQCNGKSE